MPVFMPVLTHIQGRRLSTAICSWRLALVAIIFLAGCGGSQRDITTIAGDGFPGYSGDGTAAVSATMNGPRNVAVDDTGNIYIADSLNYVIREVVASSGVITTVAGNGVPGYSGDNAAAASGSLSHPKGVAVDPSGNIYIADTGNDVIRKVTATTGIITTVAGDGRAGYQGDGGAAVAARLNSPHDVALDSSGNLFIADSGNSVIREVSTSSGVIITAAGNGIDGYSGDNGAASLTMLNNPRGIVADASGDIYIADTFKNVVRKVAASTGVIMTVAGHGTLGYSGDGGPATSAALNTPYDVALDSSGNIYVADTNNDVVREVEASSGIITTIVGIADTPGYSGDNGSALLALLNLPQGCDTGFVRKRLHRG